MQAGQELHVVWHVANLQMVVRRINLLCASVDLNTMPLEPLDWGSVNKQFGIVYVPQCLLNYVYYLKHSIHGSKDPRVRSGTILA